MYHCLPSGQAVRRLSEWQGGRQFQGGFRGVLQLGQQRFDRRGLRPIEYDFAESYAVERLGDLRGNRGQLVFTRGLSEHRASLLGELPRGLLRWTGQTVPGQDRLQAMVELDSRPHALRVSGDAAGQAMKESLRGQAKPGAYDQRPSQTEHADHIGPKP